MWNFNSCFVNRIRVDNPVYRVEIQFLFIDYIFNRKTIGLYFRFSSETKLSTDDLVELVQ